MASIDFLKKKKSGKNGLQISIYIDKSSKFIKTSRLC